VLIARDRSEHGILQAYRQSYSGSLALDAGLENMTDEERKSKLHSLESCTQGAEKAYDDMYETHSFRDANDCYRDAKDYFHAAIGHAEDLGLKEEAEALRKRLEHVKAVYRSQFTQ